MKNILRSLNEFKVLVIGLVLLSVAGSALASFLFTSPVYQSSVQILVNQNHEEGFQLTKEELKANHYSIISYSSIIKSPAILEQVRELAELDSSITDLNEKISINYAEDSQVFNLTVEDEDPAKAVLIANLAAELFKETIHEAVAADNVNILSAARIVENAVSIETEALMKMGISALLALSAGVAISLFISVLDTSLTNEEDIENVFEVPVLGRIPVIPEHDRDSDIRLPFK